MNKIYFSNGKKIESFDVKESPYEVDFKDIIEKYRPSQE